MRRVRNPREGGAERRFRRGKGGLLGLDLGREPLHLLDAPGARLSGQARDLFGRALLRRPEILDAVQVLPPRPVECQHLVDQPPVESARRHRGAEEVWLLAQQSEVDHERGSTGTGYRRAAVSRTCRAASRPALISTGCPRSARERPSASRPVSSHSGSM